MANPFMPSVAGSLNLAGQDTLQQLLQRRMMEEQLAQQSQRLQAQQMQQAFSAAMRMRGDQRSEEALRLRQGADQRTAERQQRLDAEQAAEKATKERQATNQRGAADMYFEGLTRGISPDEPGMLRSMSEGKVAVSMRPKDPKPTLDERIAERKALRTADKEVDARFKEPTKPKAPKAADLKAPPELRSEIESYATRKLPGWRTVEEAKKSIEANWPKLRAKYGTLEKSAMDAALVNIYGTRPKTQDRLGELMQMIEAQAKPISDE